MKKINENNLQQINEIFSNKNLYAKEIISAIKLASGNMNLTLRCGTKDGNSIIVKQGREFVEKYPSIAAPIGRTSVEYHYYQRVSGNDYLKKMSPQVLAICHDNQILILEDLGHGSDGVKYYQDPSSPSKAQLFKMVDYLTHLHQVKKDRNDTSLENKKMKELNSFHMFEFPFSPDGHNSLCENFPELKELSHSIIKNENVKSVASKLKNRYLKNGNNLVHGDFYPGSLFLVNDSLYVIDPEFCFWGNQEFDLGVFLGHLLMLNRSKEECASLIDHYLKSQSEIDLNLVNQFAGNEILRRLYGVAQLPFSKELSTVEHKKKVTDLALSLL